MLGIKQEALASELGDDWNQKKISLLEQKETIEPDLLGQVARALKVPKEAIENFDQEAAIVNIQNNYEGANTGSGTIGNNLNYHFRTFNPIDKMVELYERMLKEKNEKIEKLEGMVKKQ